MPAAAIFTIGHSTRTLDQFMALLRVQGIECLADIRTMPGSRRNPQFSREALAAALAREEIRYAHIPELGGLRKPRPDSINTGWKNASFRGYADYMATEPFRLALSRLLEISAKERTAIMCAEAVPWRCHRNLVADALTAREIPVEHIVGAGRTQPHRLTPFARVTEAGQVIYPVESAALDLPFAG